MTKTSKKIVFFGNERLATGVRTSAPTLQALLAAGYDVAAVVSNFRPQQSRRPRPLEIETIAQQHNIPVLLPAHPSDIADTLRTYEASAGILVAYGKLVPQEIIDIFPRGIINIHPSLLPAHRGPTPIESVILEGAHKTGVSIMALSAKMDAGDIYAQQEYALTGQETKQALTDNLLELGATMLTELLPAILDNRLTPVAQDESQATYDHLLDKSAGIIDWHKPAVRLEREIRAYSEWPKSTTTLGTIGVVITDASVYGASLPPGSTHVADKKLIVGCGDGSLEIHTLKPAGKAVMDAPAFLAGYSDRI